MTEIDALLKQRGEPASYPPMTMAERIAAFDWTQTALGPIEIWPGCLKAALASILKFAMPVCIFWGPEAISIYNDAYNDLIAGKYPELLGRKVRDIWPESIEFLDEVIESVMAGIPLDFQCREFTIVTLQGVEQIWATLDFMPIFDENGVARGGTMIVKDETENWKAMARRTPS